MRTFMLSLYDLIHVADTVERRLDKKKKNYSLVSAFYDTVILIY